MKIKKRRSKQADEMICIYDNILEVKACRYRLLKNIIENEPCVTLIINTNQRIKAQSIEQAEAYIVQTGIVYISMPVNMNPHKFLGLDIQPKKKTDERLLAMEISGEQFTKELYGILENYDIAIGIGRQLSLQDTYNQLHADEGGVLFNSSFFKESIYDSIVCSTIRSTMNIEKYIEAATNEMAL